MGVYINSIPEEDRVSPIDTNKYPSSLGVTLELCAGIIDKDKPLEQIAREEILEECGYDVPLDKIKKIKNYRGAVGFAGEHQTLFYAEVTDNMKCGRSTGHEFFDLNIAGLPDANVAVPCPVGGGVAEEGEFVEVVEKTLPEAKQMLEEETFNSPPEFLYGLLWIFHYIFPNV
ncbi:Nudix hydrolase 14, chloroplastic [Homalodisca vitripennis]|nr:Nudix hydrolase 14, chloroplastic [Homalodisca vitripennis]